MGWTHIPDSTPVSVPVSGNLFRVTPRKESRALLCHRTSWSGPPRVNPIMAYMTPVPVVPVVQTFHFSLIGDRI